MTFKCYIINVTDKSLTLCRVQLVTLSDICQLGIINIWQRKCTV